MSLLPEFYREICTVVSGLPPQRGQWENYKTGVFISVPSAENRRKPFLVVPLSAIRDKNGLRYQSLHFSRSFPRRGRRPIHEVSTQNLIELDEANIGAIELPEIAGTSRFRSLQLELAVELSEHNDITWDGVQILTPGYPDNPEMLDVENPFVRGGIIARRLNEWFFIDSQIFSRHIGGPVFLRPWNFNIGEDSIAFPHFIGVTVQSVMFERENPAGTLETAALATVCPTIRLRRLLGMDSPTQ